MILGSIFGSDQILGFSLTHPNSLTPSRREGERGALNLRDDYKKVKERAIEGGETICVLIFISLFFLHKA